jgi:hypothetical protein
MKSSTVSAALAGFMALGLLAGPSFGKSHSKPAAKKGGNKVAATSFICRHGCGKKITVKSEGEWKKTCAVCGCKKTNMQCKPDANKKP